jgi:SsrA-binding protein
VAARKSDAPPKERHGDGVVARNKRASFDYELGDRFEAGLVLLGSEVKSLRQRAAVLGDAWCFVQGGQAFVRGLNIPELDGSATGHSPKRDRKLLLHERQIAELQRAIEREGMTAVAVQLYFRGGRAKLEFALAQGKRKFDKREAVKTREADREAAAALRHANQRAR